MEEPPRVLPDDVLADVLSRLAPRSLAVSRCVCRDWRAVVDGRCRQLLRRDLLPLTVGGIFIEPGSTETPDFFARPSMARRVAGKIESFVQLYLYGYAVKYCTELVDCCNGLLLFEKKELFVVNPATRRSELLPCYHVLPEGHQGVGLYWSYLAFDPTVSPYYEVLSMQHPLNGGEMKKPFEGLQWPPPVYVMHAYSSATGRWEERHFALDDDGEGIQRRIDGVSARPYGHAAYWRGVLYVHCNSHFILRINLSDDKYQVIDLPAYANESEDLHEVYLGKSKNGIYFAQIINHTCRVLIWFLDESDGIAQWVFKHGVSQHDLITHFWGNPDAQTDRPWILQDCDSQEEFKLGQAVEEEKNLDWDSDDESAVDVKDYCDAKNTFGFLILGFHPYKEILFLHLFESRGISFWQIQGSNLGELCSKFPENKGRSAFIYTPCWVEDLFENS